MDHFDTLTAMDSDDAAYCVQPNPVYHDGGIIIATAIVIGVISAIVKRIPRGN